MVVTTARVTAKVARVVVAGATRMTVTMVTMVMMTTMAEIAATMTPNGDKHSNQILSRHQRRGTCW